jgi:glycosyltransferase involved in cell wall biosynthesis
LVRASIAMAVYNGEKFMRLQIDSILEQMKTDDEIVISVDPCQDGSRKIALEYAEKDKRISVLDGPGSGVIKNFENALYSAKGEFIFLADQDDVWFKDKLERMLGALGKEGVLAAAHDAEVVDGDLNIISESYYKGGFYTGILKNVIRNRYMGCCMAFRSRLIEYAMPFPENLPMHDQWLGIVAKKYGNVEFIDSPLIYYRRHEKTLTGREKAGILKRLKWRACILIDYIRLRKKAMP